MCFLFTVPEDSDKSKSPYSRGPYFKAAPGMRGPNKSPKGPKGASLPGDKGGPRRRRTRYLYLFFFFYFQLIVTLDLHNFMFYFFMWARNKILSI